MDDGSSEPFPTPRVYVTCRSVLPGEAPDADPLWDGIRDLPPVLRQRLTKRAATVAEWGLLDGLVGQARTDVLRRLADGLLREHESSERKVRERMHRANVPIGEVIYYLRFGDRVKIGTTQNLARRLANLPHDELLAIEPGGRDIEKIRHEQFVHLHSTGEWFRIDDQMLEHIAGLQRQVA